MPTERDWLEPPNVVLPHGNEVHIWRANLEAETADVARFSAMLSADEKDRAARFHFSAHRDSYIAAHGILRDILARVVAQAPAALTFSSNRYGKPCFAPGSEFERVHFNLSHSGGRALYAVTLIGEVGVDLEKIRPLPDIRSLVNTVFSPREAALFFSLPDASQLDAYFTCWTRKEAYLKARGEGFGIEPSSFEVTFAPGAPAAIVGLEHSAWWLCELAPATGFVGAVAAKAHAVDLNLWDWNARGDEPKSLSVDSFR